MNNLIVFIVIIFVSKVSSQENQTLPKLLSLNAYSIRYVKLDNLFPGIFAASPLVILDVPTLARQTCFKNVRSTRFALGIPIVFWNSTYMDDLNSQKSSILEVGRNIVQILPPSNILKFQINWRRPNFYSSNILLDTSWYNADVNYVMPMYHTFIMEFEDGNSSNTLCNNVRNDFITEPAQRQELEIKFRRQEFGYKRIPEITIRTNDIYAIEPIRSGCRPNYYYGYNYNNVNCFIYLESAQKVAYEVANNVLQKLGVQAVQLQKKLESSVYQYLCKSINIYGNSYNTVIGTSNFINNQTLICTVPYEVYASFGNNNNTVVSLESSIVNREQEEFSIPILNIF